MTKIFVDMKIAITYFNGIVDAIAAMNSGPSGQWYIR